MCIYVQVFCKKYLHIPTALCVTILLYFARNTCIYCAGFCSGFSAPDSAPVSARLHRHLRGRIAVASPSHRRRISTSHRPRIASLHETQATCRLH
jgi:hypothetical protein